MSCNEIMTSARPERSRSARTWSAVVGAVAALLIAPATSAATVYVAKKFGTIELLDANMQTESTLSVSCLHDGVATDGERIWCTSFGTTVYTYDFAGTLLDQWSYAVGPYSYTGGMTYIPDTDELAILDVDTLDGAQALRFFDPDTGVLNRSGHVGFGFYEGLAYDGTYLWVLDDRGELRAYDVFTFALELTLDPDVGDCLLDCGALTAYGPDELTVVHGPAILGEDTTWARVDKSTGAAVEVGVLPEPVTGLEWVPRSCTQPPAGMVSWYKGDTCTPADFLGNNHGSYVGFPVCPLARKVGGGALAFGDGTYVSVPDTPSLDPGDGGLSVDAWIQTSAGGSQPIVEKLAGAGYSLSLLDGLPRLVVCDASLCGIVEGSTRVDDGGWHLVAASIERGESFSTELSLYVDGALEASADFTLGTVASASDLLLGAAPAGGPSTFFAGVLDEIEIFDRALDPTEIEEIFAADVVGKCTASCVDPPDGLVAWWPLDETTEELASDLSATHDGVHVGCPTPVPGRVDVALELHGGERVEVADDLALDMGTGDFTVDAWVRTNDDGIHGIVDKHDTSGVEDGYHFFVSGGLLGFHIHHTAGTVVAVGAAGVADGTWHHVAVTVDRDDPRGLRFYVDGALDSMHDPTAAAGTYVGGSVDLWLGYHRALAIGMVGALDEVELFGRALSPAEIQALYEAGAAGKCKDTEISNVTLEATALRRGQPATLTARGAVPGETVHFARGSGAGCGPCIPQFGGLCVDVVGPSLLGSASADASGVASLTIVVPPTAPLADLWIQAAVPRGQGGADSVKSSVQAATIKP